MQCNANHFVDSPPSLLRIVLCVGSCLSTPTRIAHATTETQAVVITSENNAIAR
jgi:hypothetical protein